MFRGKKYQESAKQIDKAALYEVNEAMELVREKDETRGRYR